MKHTLIMSLRSAHQRVGTNLVGQLRSVSPSLRACLVLRQCSVLPKYWHAHNMFVLLGWSQNNWRAQTRPCMLIDFHANSWASGGWAYCTPKFWLPIFGRARQGLIQTCPKYNTCLSKRRSQMITWYLTQRSLCYREALSWLHVMHYMTSFSSCLWQ
jgi:hypothetical protein